MTCIYCTTIVNNMDSPMRVRIREFPYYDRATNSPLYKLQALRGRNDV